MTVAPPAREGSAVVLFGIGSPIIGDVVESLRRVGVGSCVGVYNRATPSFLPHSTILVSPSGITAELAILPYMIPLFTPRNRRSADKEATTAGLRRAFTLIDPTCIVPRDVGLGDGGYINAGCVLGTSVHFGRFAFVNRGASIGHHLRAGEFVSIGPSAVVAGNVTIEDDVLIGAGAIILPERTIGRRAIVGAGAVVTRDVPADCLVIGNPARIERRNLWEADGRHDG